MPIGWGRVRRRNVGGRSMALDRLGAMRIGVDGSWDISDLLALSESLSESYGLFYPLVVSDEEIKGRLHDQLRRILWSGDIDSRHIGRDLYRQIPRDESLKLRSFNYSSPGYVEIFGAISCIGMLAKVAQAWIRGVKEFIDLWERVDKFFEKRKHLRRPKRETALDADLAIGSDEARALCFEVGANLGFDPLSCERIISIVGNPIAALKYLVAAGNEGRKIAQLENSNLIHLPEVQGEVHVTEARSGVRKGRSGVVVERVPKPRKKGPQG